ncbi:unknown protein [Seminavis robusta]|uniref:Uncharacterized protein n=1 Tax=Seminavis robusta TaxID=568900 RepID=A0A9N8F1H2_9STRA|nr:unknown protein [Seminavis robusta]|eukprot:Sro4248_g353510.1 n/a (258) ;mRNA; f:1392-2165
MLTKGWTMFCDLHVGALPDPEDFHGLFMETNMDTFKCSININHPVPEPGLDFTILHTWLLVGCFITLLCFSWLYSPDQPSTDPIDAPPPEPQSRWMRHRHAQAYRRWKRRANRSKGASIRDYGCNRKYPLHLRSSGTYYKEAPPLSTQRILGGLRRWFHKSQHRPSGHRLRQAFVPPLCVPGGRSGIRRNQEITLRQPSTDPATIRMRPMLSSVKTCMSKANSRLRRANNEPFAAPQQPRQSGQSLDNQGTREGENR